MQGKANPAGKQSKAEASRPISSTVTFFSSFNVRCTTALAHLDMLVEACSYQAIYEMLYLVSAWFSTNSGVNHAGHVTTIQIVI
jgi:hypothetical protein